MRVLIFLQSNGKNNLTFILIKLKIGIQLLYNTTMVITVISYIHTYISIYFHVINDI